MKITKLLPITMAFALSLSGAAFAAAGNTSTVTAPATTYQLTLSDYYDISVTPGTTERGTNFTGFYEGIAIDGSFTPSFTVTSNKVSDHITFYAECKSGASTVKALYGENLSNLRIVFTKVAGDGSYGAAAPALDAGLEEGQAFVLSKDTMKKGQESSRDAIAFGFTADTNAITKPDVLGTITPSWDSTNQVINYTISNGKYVIPYTITGSALDNSFDTADSQGLYQATLYMQRAGLGE